MNHITYRISLDMFDTSSQTTIKAKKGDSACKIQITLAESGKIYKIGEGCSATFNAKKSDGNFIYDNCAIEDNTIVYDFTSSIKDGIAQISACEGIVECEVTLYNATGEQLTSPRFTLVIDGTVYNGEEIISTSVSDVFEKNTNKVDSLFVDEDKLQGKYPSALASKQYTYNACGTLRGEVENFKTEVIGAVNSKADKTELANMENTDYKVTNLDSEPPTHDFYPSAKAVYKKVTDAVGKVVEKFDEELENKADKSQINDIETALDNKVDKEEGKTLYRGMELIYEDTLTAEDTTASVYWIKTDMSGNAFKLDETYLYIQLPTKSDTALGNISGIFNTGSGAENYWFVLQVKANADKCQAYGKRVKENHWFNMMGMFAGDLYSSQFYGSYKSSGVDYVTALKISNIKILPEGTKILFCGRRVD